MLARVFENIIGDIDNFKAFYFQSCFLKSFPLSTVYKTLAMLEVTAGKCPFAFAATMSVLRRQCKMRLCRSKSECLAKGIQNCRARMVKGLGRSTEMSVMNEPAPWLPLRRPKTTRPSGPRTSAATPTRTFGFDVDMLSGYNASACL